MPSRNLPAASKCERSMTRSMASPRPRAADSRVEHDRPVGVRAHPVIGEDRVRLLGRCGILRDDEIDAGVLEPLGQRRELPERAPAHHLARCVWLRGLKAVRRGGFRIRAEGAGAYDEECRGALFFGTWHARQNSGSRVITHAGKPAGGASPSVRARRRCASVRVRRPARSRPAPRRNRAPASLRVRRRSRTAAAM